MQTQADAASDSELCESVSSTVVPEEDVPAMTVKQEEEEAAVLCQSPEPPPPPAATNAEAEIALAAISTELTGPEEQQKLPETPPERSLGSHNDNKVERGRGRGRRRSRWKLKFHHQALPPEYLDHYEATIAQQEAKSNAILAGAKAPHGPRGNNEKTQNKNSAKQSHVTKGCAEKAVSDAKSGPEKSSKQSPSPLQCLPVKLEPESQPLQFSSIVQASPLLLNTAAATVEPSGLIPLQALSLGSTESDMMSRLQDTFQSHHIDDDISIINERKGSPASNSNKGLLSCLLSSNQQSSALPSAIESSSANRNVPSVHVEQRHSANAKRRSSVIMSATNPNFSTGTSLNSSVSQQQGTTSKVMKYQDLPYMGEITLDNMKPRRGRKPKKADICHLIYKNYGTIFPGAPNSAEPEDSRKKVPSETHTVPSSPVNSGHKSKLDTTSLGIKCRAIETLKGNSGSQINHADVQNRIISSLLEKRLTAAAQQESRKFFLQNTAIPDYSTMMLPPNCSGAWNKRTVPVPLTSPVLPTPSPSTTPACSDEPLNLCVKDLNQLKIRLLRKHGNFYEPHNSSTTNSSEDSVSMKHASNMSPISVKSEPPSHVSELEEMLEVSNDSLKYSGTGDETCGEGSKRETPTQSSSLTESFQPSSLPGLSLPAPADIPGTPPGAAPLPAGYVYWPGAGVFVHPMALQSQLLYYQKMGAIPLVSMPATEPALSTQTFIPAAPVSIPHLNSSSNLSLQPSQSPKSISSMSKLDHKQPLSVTNSKHIIPKHFSPANQGKMPPELSFPRMKRLPSLGNSGSVISGGAKRKRSAIFIPPMPSENNSSPTTEVSICKFKFTGGAKPSLQEKKMLSVDSGGNFRYYSGTGDKSMRGYEFFPRESLQQPAGVTGGSPSEHFLAAAASASEKISPTVTAALRENSGIGAYSVDEHRKFLTSTPTENVAKGISSPFSELNPSMAISPEVDATRKMSGGRCFLDQTARKKGDCGEIVDSSNVNMNESQQGPSSQHFRFQRRKRKTRKSLAREKLEQTFKEKGFLIQTQQLESAEGATYCKFRQLRKFTRYLFRSWKDYLPGNVREMSVAAGVSGTSPPHQEDSDGEVSSNSPPPTLVTPQSPLDDASKPSPAT